MKAQAAMEFTVLVIFTLIFIFAFYSSIFGSQLRAQDQQIQGRLDIFCSDFAEKISNAYYYGNGFSQNITVYSNIYGAGFNVTVYNFSLACENTRYSSIKRIPTGNVTYNSAYPPFVVPQKTVQIENVGDRIVIS